MTQRKRYGVVIALAVILVAITMWASHHMFASAVATDPIYQAQHLIAF
jgi:hypothetical protein